MLVAVALLALWARSYWHSDGASGRLSTWSFRVASSEGSVHGVTAWSAPSALVGEVRWRTRELKAASGPPAPNKRNPLWLLNFQHAHDAWFVNIPHWLLALLMGSAGVALWRGMRQFTLRTMLGLTTLVALVAAMSTRG